MSPHVQNLTRSACPPQWKEKGKKARTTKQVDFIMALTEQEELGKPHRGSEMLITDDRGTSRE